MYASYALGKNSGANLGLGLVYLRGELGVGGRALDLRQLCGIIEIRDQKVLAPIRLTAYIC